MDALKRMKRKPSATIVRLILSLSLSLSLCLSLSLSLFLRGHAGGPPSTVCNHPINFQIIFDKYAP
jgi:hypothetical protein